MAHNIENRNGKSSIAYSGDTPWHRLGQKLDQAFDSATALDQAGLDFEVTKTPICTADDGVAIPGRFALRRTDTKSVLGVCTDFYQPLQNREAFRFFDGIFGKDQARYEVAGVLGKGEKVWMLAKLPATSASQATTSLASGSCSPMGTTPTNPSAPSLRPSASFAKTRSTPP